MVVEVAVHLLRQYILLECRHVGFQRTVCGPPRLRL